MNLFLLISASAFAAAFAVVLVTVVIWKDLAVGFKSVRRRITRRFEPLADAARLDRAALRLSRSVLRFEASDWSAAAGRV